MWWVAARDHHYHNSRGHVYLNFRLLLGTFVLRTQLCMPVSRKAYVNTSIVRHFFLPPRCRIIFFTRVYPLCIEYLNRITNTIKITNFLVVSIQNFDAIFMGEEKIIVIFRCNLFAEFRPQFASGPENFQRQFNNLKFSESLEKILVSTTKCRKISVSW